MLSTTPTPAHIDSTTPWKLDSAASDHFAGVNHVREKTFVTNGITVGVANGNSMQQVATAPLPFENIPEGADGASLFANMPNPLLGCGRFVKEGCYVVLDTPTAQVIDKKTGNVIISADFEPWSATWNVYPNKPQRPILPGPTQTRYPRPPLETPTKLANNAYRIHTKGELATFYGGSAGWPVKSTWIDAINRGSYASWPGLTAAMVHKHYKRSEFTVLGHLHARRSGIQSTKKQVPVAEMPVADLVQEENASLTPPRPGILLTTTRHVGAHLIAFSSLKSYIATDFCGRFPDMSSRGMNYIFILYDYDSNTILAAPTKSRHGPAMIEAYDKCYKQLTDAGLTPVLQYLDNEISKDLIESIKTKKLNYQLASPNDHRLNPAERAVQTFKNHFVSILTGCDRAFPKYLWCRLIPQAVQTLNFLRKSRINPKLSAHDQVFGVFDYNRTPLAPLGTKVVIHERPKQRGTWSAHGQLGWLTGPAMHHYRHFQINVSSTGGDRVSDTVEFIPTNYIMPRTSSRDRIAAALDEITHAIANPCPRSPFLNGEQTQEIVNELSDIFSTHEQPPRVVPLRPRPKTPSAQPPPRVARPRIQPLPYPNGTVIAKVFDNTVYNGTIHHHDARRNLYKIIYTDGDSEELTHSEVAKELHLEKKRLSKPARLLTHADPWTTQQSGRRRSPRITKLHSAGFCNAANNLSPNWYDAVADIRQPYKYANSVLDKETGKQLEYRQLINHPRLKTAWLHAGGNEFGRLFQGMNDTKGIERVKGTNTCFWIPKHMVPRDKKVTYPRIVCDEKPDKDEVNRVRITAQGQLLEYLGDVATETAGLTTTKILFNSVLSTAHAKFMALDISNMYLNTHLKDFQYMKFRLNIIPQDVIDQYNLLDLVDKDGWVYCEIRKAIYGLKESGKLANIQLKKVLANADYHPCRFTHGLYRHKTRPIAFSLVVDDFGVKYTNKCDAEHLLSVLSAKYPMKADWTGTRYLGMSLKWTYANIHKDRNVQLSMPGYVNESLILFGHILKTPTHAASPYTAPIYGKHQQMATVITAPTFTDKEVKRLQNICGRFLYYARAIDSTMMHALNDLATQITTGTMSTTKAIDCFLNYAATHPNASITYYASDMILKCDSDAAYLVAPKARSRAGGYIYLGNHCVNTQIINAPIMVIATILKMVVGSAAEAEIAALYHCAQELVPLRTACIELGHKQPTTGTPLRTDNSTANGILNGTLHQKRSKAIDMRFYWLQDRVSQKMFKVAWAPGKVNLADYYTKHHPSKHVRRVRPLYTTQANSPRDMQGCVELLAAAAA